MKVAIIGGGASGCMTALQIKKINKNIIVDLYEKEDKLLKKVAATGGGRCNLGNKNIRSEVFNNPKFIESFINSYDVNSYLSYFEENGLLLASENDLLYPYSFTSSRVIDFFNSKLKSECVNVLLNKEVFDIKYGDKILVNNQEYDKVVIAIGSKALFNKDVYKLVSDFKITNIRQSLVGFKSFDINNMKGVRQKCLVKLVCEDKIIYEELGEVQFKDDGLSGICVMNASSKYYDGCHLEIDFFPNKELDFLKELYKTNKLSFTLEPKILDLVECKNIEEVSRFKSFKVTINGLYDYKFAQVCKGGIDLSEVEMFRSKKYSNLYFTGEVLDIDAICGGFNLWFAFNSGMKVGEEICM